MKAIYIILVYAFLAFSVDLVFTENILAQSPDPAAAVALAAAQPQAPAVILPPANVSVAAPAAPPQWAADLIVAISTLPVIGPLVGKAMVYAGILSSILTAIVACMLGVLSTLSGAFNFAGLAGFAAKLELFKNGRIMYWLSYLSMFNAKKPESLKA